MQAVILSGGKGTRLRPLTYQAPKPMISINGKPFLQHQLELLKSFGIYRVLLLLSYLAKQIENHFADGLDFGMSIRYSYEDTPLGTGGALKNAEDMLDDTFVLLNGDTLLQIDYSKLVSQFQSYNKIGLIVAYGNSEQIAPNNLKVGENDIVLGYDKQSDNGMTHVDAGVIALRKRVLELIPTGCVCSLEEEVFMRLIEAGELTAFRTDQRFYDMGTFEGLKRIEQVLK